MVTEQVITVVVLVVTTIVVGAAAATVRYYARVLRRAPRRHGLLLWHVVLVAGSVAGVEAMIALAQLELLGIVATPRWVRLLGHSMFGTGLAASILLIAMEQRRRVQSLPPSESPVRIDDDVLPPREDGVR